MKGASFQAVGQFGFQKKPLAKSRSAPQVQIFIHYDKNITTHIFKKTDGSGASETPLAEAELPVRP